MRRGMCRNRRSDPARVGLAIDPIASCNCSWGAAAPRPPAALLTHFPRRIAGNVPPPQLREMSVWTLDLEPPPNGLEKNLYKY
jgi:hypothetical protein